MLGPLPLHPLLVHFAVVMVLATALLQLLALAAGRVRRWLGWVLPALGVATAVVTRVTESFGEVLARSRPGTPAIAEHAGWGERTAAAAIALGVLAVLQWLATADDDWPRRRAGFLRGRAARLVVAVLTGLAAVAALVLVVLAGHTGSLAVWGR